MYSEFGQKMMGGIYILTGVMLAIQAWNAICGLGGESSTANGVTTVTPNAGAPGFMQGMAGMGINMGGML
jgi:hypothetical protein